VQSADTKKAREEKLLVIPAGLVRRFVLEERKVSVEDSEICVNPLKWIAL